MHAWDVIAIDGVGLIGGSIGMAVREHGLAARVIGIGRNPETLETARRLGAIDEGTTDLRAGVAQAGLVIVATPVHRIAERVCETLGYSDALVTDAGSTKRELVETIEQSAPHATGGRFVGSHPLAGSEQSGVTAATATLFTGRTVVVTPTSKTLADDVETLQEFWQQLGASVRLMSPEDHDRVLAQTSHVPHLLASLLAGTTPRDWLDLTASGWRDSTRIAAGDVELWLPILMQNRHEILNALSRIDGELKQFQQALSSEDTGLLSELLTKGKLCRDALGS